MNVYSRPEGFGGRLGWGVRPALLLVDLVRAYFTPGAPFYLDAPEVIGRCSQLLKRARDAQTPIAHTTVRYRSDGVDGGLFVQKIPSLKIFCEGSAHNWHETVPELLPQGGEIVVTKQYASAFSGTSLAATLTSMRVDTVVICGVSTSGCVRATATDAVQLGLRPLVVGQACADRSAAIHDANLSDLDLKYADVIDMRDALSGLAQPNNHSV